MYYCVSRYKKEVRTALEREETLQQAKAQAEVDWQRRCEDIERQQYERSEDLVRRLTKARDQVSLITHSWAQTAITSPVGGNVNVLSGHKGTVPYRNMKLPHSHCRHVIIDVLIIFSATKCGPLKHICMVTVWYITISMVI